MTSGPSVVLCLHRENAVGRLLDVLGPSDARAAKKQSQFYLRGSFGEDSIKNGFYGKVLKKLGKSLVYCVHQLIYFPREIISLWSLVVLCAVL